jgi:steroid delta-isomerase-like uncharacterized protein
VDVSKYLFAALLLGLAGCGRDQPPAPATPPPQGKAAVATAGQPTPASAAAPASAPANLALVTAYLQAWNQHDIAAAGRFLSEDSEYFDAAFAGMQRGRPAIEEHAIGVFLRGVPDLHWEIRSAPVVGNEGVAYEWTLTGTNTGTWGGIPATRQKISLKGLTFVRIRGGKIVYQAVVYDSATLNRQLGL